MTSVHNWFDSTCALGLPDAWKAPAHTEVRNLLSYRKYCRKKSKTRYMHCWNAQPIMQEVLNSVTGFLFLLEADSNNTCDLHQREEKSCEHRPASEYVIEKNIPHKLQMSHSTDRENSQHHYSRHPQQQRNRTCPETTHNIEVRKIQRAVHQRCKIPSVKQAQRFKLRNGNLTLTWAGPRGCKCK